MKELKIEKLSKSYGIKTLIDQVDFAIRTGDRIGLIGPNGTGKSTFLKVIAGIESYDAGEISKPNQYTIAYLGQKNHLNPDLTIRETVYQSKDPLIQLLLDYQSAQVALEKDPQNPKLQDRLTHLGEAMTHQGAWEIEVKAKTILSQLQITDLDQKLGQCSGGQQKRVALAQVLMTQADLLILDEPTNHLDIDSILWLEKFLANYPGALLIVTHDRYFLERSVNKIVELSNGRIREYEGNYEAYLTQKSEQDAIEARTAHKRQRFYERELAWMRQGAQARSTKQQARVDRFHELKDQLAQKQMPQADLTMDFGQQRMGNQVLELDGVDLKVADHQIIKDFTKTFVKGDRLGIVGANGVGKSSFLNLLAGYLTPDAGEYRIGQTVSIAYYRQLDQDLPHDMRVLAYLTQLADQFKRPDGSKVSASLLLEQFNFAKESHGLLIGQLSGGERRRLYLLTLLVQEPNVLLLDEPTNDLDIQTLSSLEEYLESFQGLVIIVSHDRYFLDKTVDQILELQGQGQSQFFWGNYSDFLAKKSSNSSNGNTSSKAVIEKDLPEPQANSKRQRMTYHEKKEWQALPQAIEKCEQKIEEVEGLMQEAGSDADRLMDLQTELEEAEAQLLEYYERYDYLSDLEQ